MQSLNQLALGIFFLYFVLLSGSCSNLLNCSLQRYVNDSIFFKHILIFLSIYIFTFILNWYTVDSLVTEKFENIKSENNNETNKSSKIESLSYLLNSLYYSVLIYIIFLLSSKAEGVYLAFFLGAIVLLVISQIILKAIYDEHHIFNLQNIYRSNEYLKRVAKENNFVYHQTLISILRALPILYLIVGIILVIGVSKYYIRQRQEHLQTWNTLIFIFGNNKCSNL